MSQGVDQKPRENALLHVDGFEGELRAKKHSALMRWSVTIGRHGGIALAFEATTVTAENKWLFEAGFPDGPLLQPLPLANIDLRQIKHAIDARNLVVHRGLFRSEKERRLHEYVVLLRELLKRIFLTLLGYKGQYFSLLNGPQWLRFPPE